MKKKYLIFLFLILTFSIIIESVEAKAEYNEGETYDCIYEWLDQKAAFNRSDSSPTVYWKGDSFASDNIANWVLPFPNTKTRGSIYTDNKTCPKYLIYYETGWNKSQNFAIADSDEQVIDIELGNQDNEDDTQVKNKSEKDLVEKYIKNELGGSNIKFYELINNDEDNDNDNGNDNPVNNLENYDCKYRTASSDSVYAAFNRGNSSPSVYTVDVLLSSGEIINWDSRFEGTSTDGKQFVSNNSCPQFLIFHKNVPGYAVTNKDDYQNVISFLINKYGTVSNRPLDSGTTAIEVYTLIPKSCEDAIDSKTCGSIQDSCYWSESSESCMQKPNSCEEIKNSKTCNDNNLFSCIWSTSSNSCSSIPTSCSDIKIKDVCKSNDYFACVWNEDYGYCNTDNLRYVACGNARDIPYQLPHIISFGVNLLKIAVPIILVLVSMITLVKAIISSNEDDMKKAQKSLVRRAIAAVIIFFIVSIVQLVMSVAADASDVDSIPACIDCFLSNDCGSVTYYKTSVNGEYQCRNVETGEYIDCKYPES